LARITGPRCLKEIRPGRPLPNVAAEATPDMTKHTHFPHRVPMPQSAPKCADCKKPFYPPLAGIERCFKCELAAKRATK
jgi:hypothetical protein